MNKTAYGLYMIALLVACQSVEGDDTDPPELEEVDLVTCIQDPSCDYVYATGHRGAMLYAPENTMLAIELAIDMGVTIVEIDVRPTSDEVLVVMHDTTVNRTTNGTGLVDEMTLAELQQLKATSEFEGIDDQPIPTFQDVMAATVGRVLIDLDVKTHRYDLVVAEIEAAGAEEWINIQVGSVADGQAVRSLNPDLRVAPDVSTVEDVNTHYEAYQPELMELPWYVDEVEPVAHAIALGVRCTQDSMGVADVAAKLREDRGEDTCEPFKVFWERGIRVIQTDAHHLLVPCLAKRNAESGYVHTVKSP